MSPRLSLAPLAKLIGDERKSLALSGRRAARALVRVVAFNRQRFEGTARMIDSLSYKSVLRRGFAVVRDAAGVPVHAAAAVKQNQALLIEFTDGQVKARDFEKPRHESCVL